MSKSIEWTKLNQFQKSIIEKQHSEVPVKLGQADLIKIGLSH